MTTGKICGEAKKQRTIAVICLIASLFCFACVPLFIKHFARHLDAWTVNGIRYSTATLLLLVFVITLRRKSPEYRRVWRAAFWPAVVNLCGQVIWAMIPYHSDASVFGFGIRSTFLFTILFGMVMLPKERPMGRIPLFWIGTIVSIAGLFVMYGASLGKSTGTTITGVILIVVTSVFWGLYLVFVKRFLSEFPARLSFGVICIYTSVGLIILMLLKGNLVALKMLSPQNWGLLVLSGVVGIAIAHMLLYRAIGVLGPIVVSGAHLSSPFLTWLGATIFLGEHMTRAQVSGGLVLITGVLLLVMARARLGGDG